MEGVDWHCCVLVLVFGFVKGGGGWMGWEMK